MVLSKGLKVGDTFTEGGFEYEVKSVDDLGNYVSSLVGKASEEDCLEEVKVESDEDADYNDIPYSDLKKIAKDKGVSGKGSKEELIERLKGV